MSTHAPERRSLRIKRLKNVRLVGDRNLSNVTVDHHVTVKRTQQHGKLQWMLRITALSEGCSE
eukprot:5115670-Amphidinium_carterae.1